MRSGNTFDAHRLVHLGAAHGLQDAMEERLMQAYQGEGELMSDHAALERLGVEAGLPADEVRELLAGDRFADAVRDDERAAASLGISAVPFFVVGPGVRRLRRAVPGDPRRLPPAGVGGAPAGRGRGRRRRLRPGGLLSGGPE